ncbi:unnamed protein product [Brugia pahangi]|uniref:IF rod domain-containing protein n=1 Tax=Brugia pahangi TaxID=6280 RepID=A0A0N4TAU2_BRUPA|nr:unnamed protein product [Brugia pahangi]
MQQQSSRNDLDEKNDEIDKLNKQIDDLKWSLGEYKQWLNDANERIYQLVNACKEKDDIINDVTHRFHDVERRLLDVPTDQSIENLNSLINEMRKEINDKNDCINQLEKAKSDAQWYLGEHQHWLQDANTR